MKPLLVFAMKEESQDVFGDYDVLHTGIGKVSASYAMTKYLGANKPDLVINMGTAGSTRFLKGTIVNCTKFIQRDMDVTALGIEKYKTPFSDDPIVLKYGQRQDGLPEGLCASGDSFDASATAEFDVVDMEAYALAMICKREGIPFLCLKYISDGADDDAGLDWQESLHKTAENLLKTLKGLNL